MLRFLGAAVAALLSASLPVIGAAAAKSTLQASVAPSCSSSLIQQNVFQSQLADPVEVDSHAAIPPAFPVHELPAGKNVGKATITPPAVEPSQAESGKVETDVSGFGKVIGDAATKSDLEAAEAKSKPPGLPAAAKDAAAMAAENMPSSGKTQDDDKVAKAGHSEAGKGWTAGDAARQADMWMKQEKKQEEKSSSPSKREASPAVLSDTQHISQHILQAILPFSFGTSKTETEPSTGRSRGWSATDLAKQAEMWMEEQKQSNSPLQPEALPAVSSEIQTERNNMESSLQRNVLQGKTSAGEHIVKFTIERDWGLSDNQLIILILITAGLVGMCGFGLMQESEHDKQDFGQMDSMRRAQYGYGTKYPAEYGGAYGQDLPRSSLRRSKPWGCC